MKRIYKNIITITLAALLAGATIFTVIYAKNESSNSQTAAPANEEFGISNIDANDIAARPDQQDNNSNNDSVPPEKPDEENNANDELGDIPPSNSDNENSFNDGQDGMPPSKPDDTIIEQQNSNSANSNLSVGYCALISAEILLFCLILAYLIMSNFNQKNFKDTFISGEKIAIYILSSIDAAAILAVSVILITNNFILSSSTSTKISENSNESSNISYSSASEITKSTTIDGNAYESTKSDENALSINGNIEITANNINVNKTGDSDGGDNTSFYGTNSAIIAKNGATLNLKNANITTDATGANGVFSYGGSATTNNSSSDGTTINISDSTITTKKDNSGGIMTTGGGIMNASNLTVETAGTSSAAIRTDRGGGTVNVDGGTYKTTGQGSPSIYSTANVTVKNASLIATTSEGAIIEGKNSILLENVSLIDSNTKLNGQSTTFKNIFLYQSMSGDADDGTSEFTAKNSTIVTNNGDSFYVTNTTAKITLTNNKITNNDNTGNFLRVKADSWGKSGSNGGAVTLTMYNQEINGTIVVDSVSTLDINMYDGSIFVGIINEENTGKEISLKLDKESRITLNGNSYISNIEDEDTSYQNINFNGFKLYVNGTAIN